MPMNEKNDSLQQYVSTSLVEMVTDRIRSNIYNGKYPGGHKLIVRELSEELGVSHTPIKDALNRLVSEGYVEALPRRSMIVKQFTNIDLIEDLQIRLIYELSSVEHIIDELQANDSVIREMEDAYERMCLSIDESGKFLYQKWIDAETDFHYAYMRLCGNKKLFEAYKKLDSNRNCYFMYLYKENEPLSVVHYKKYMPEHRCILDAVIHRDKKTLAEMIAQHISTVSQQYVKDDEKENVKQRMMACAQLFYLNHCD